MYGNAILFPYKENVMKNFGIRLKMLREERGLSVEELAEKFGLKDIPLILWEQGKIAITIKTIIKLAKYFNVSVDYLLGL